ncbi:50S ribosomal protein L11 methyltransferase [Virgisporangium aliadipatigenens]|uniref:50S ribosomal protein L11 methyltransferase n=1 Tax=Virgisporangium aliadipatigenens TaxID=741659 RepID=A0A8J3YHJ9_9ACTN|nr:50S ribosomal protein L11 methyltransferase [Virgisporangium aliadipatigenens]GIJ44078.1 50S ribosomal protein L11 methyltransferase [Virgisporangium aliadipatigenens]
MPGVPAAALTPYVALGTGEVDALRLERVDFVPEVGLYLAEDSVVLRARLESRFGSMAASFWSTAWAGGQVLARYVLDHPDVVAGRRVLDVASGSGLVAIAAALAGAARVTANDIDPLALAAVELNAAANGVVVGGSTDDLLGGDGGDAEVVLAGDAFYSTGLAVRMSEFLHRCAARGARVLVGEPGRGHVPPGSMEIVKTYTAHGLGAPEDAGITEVTVLRPAGRPS